MRSGGRKKPFFFLSEGGGGKVWNEIVLGWVKKWGKVSSAAWVPML